MIEGQDQSPDGAASNRSEASPGEYNERAGLSKSTVEEIIRICEVEFRRIEEKMDEMLRANARF